MDEEKRDDAGRFEEDYPDDAFVEAVESLHVASTSNVAEYVGCSYDLAYRRLDTLFGDNEIKREKVGRAFVFYIE
ncbi:transcriptional regulator [Natronomonas marina]|jgi:hypothetical protein|uniref:transcriptional regulator n=1 Tax=Natronomonas marina TaxID=2961939 RepID=UPI0020C97026|nr:transcriptional regulator [Natronomonas marina]